MGMDVTIQRTGSKISLHGPAHSDLVREAVLLGGRRGHNPRTWLFDARDEQRVRDLAKRVYGTDGTLPELVTVRVDLADWEEGDVAVFAGRQIAIRPGRDADVRLSPGVVLVAGKLSGRGGSGQYTAINADKNVEVEIHDFPRAALSLVEDDAYEIVRQESPLDTGALRAERAELLARIAEIDSALATTSATITE